MVLISGSKESKIYRKCLSNTFFPGTTIPGCYIFSGVLLLSFVVFINYKMDFVVAAQSLSHHSPLNRKNRNNCLFLALEKYNPV